MAKYKSESNAMRSWHLTVNPEIYEPMRNNTFELVVDGLDNLSPAGIYEGATGTDATLSAYSGYNRDVIRFSVNKVSIPNFTQSVIEINRGNTKVKFAGTMSFSEGNIEVIDYIGDKANSKSVLMAWQKLSGDIVTEAVGRASDYKKTAYLLEYTPDFELVRTWTIYGAWVSSVSNDEMSNEGGNDKRVITANIVFDKAVLNSTDKIDDSVQGTYNR